MEEKLSICNILKKNKSKNELINELINEEFKREVIEGVIEEFKESWKKYISRAYSLWKKIYETYLDSISNNIKNIKNIKNIFMSCDSLFIVNLNIEKSPISVDNNIDNLFKKIFVLQHEIINNLFQKIIELLNTMSKYKNENELIRIYKLIKIYINREINNYTVYILKEFKDKDKNIIENKSLKKNIYNKIIELNEIIKKNT